MSPERPPLELIREATEILQDAQVHQPQWTAEQLLGFQLGKMPVELYADNPSVRPQEELRFRADVAARAGGMPLQYLLGTASFYGREFSVGPGVFIPRPETEILVDVALELLKACPVSGHALPVVVDVGTGCGTIAVTLVLEEPRLRVMGVDISRQALSFAQENGARHQAQVAWIQGNLLSSVTSDSADLVVANLPYLDPETAAQWPQELAWEPWLALNGGRYGVEAMDRLMQEANRVIRPGGFLILEIGGAQAGLLRTLADRHRLQVRLVENDLAGLERIAVLKPGVKEWKN